MKSFSMLSLTIGVALATSACNNTSGGGATPIDSTNDNGTAPVQYSQGNPENRTDSTMQSQPMDQKARQDNSAEASMQHPSTNMSEASPVSPSNTDSSTTSGSSNNKKK